MKVGDVMLIQDANAVRGNWQIGQVQRLHCSNDDACRKVDIRYRVPTKERCSIMNRAVKNTVILLPVEDNNTDIIH